MCDRCDRLEARVGDLENEVAYLRSEMGLTISASRLDRVRTSLGLAHAPARMLLAMHAAYPRVLSVLQLEDAAERPCGGQALEVVRLYINHIRRALGFDAVETARGSGYRLSEAGRARAEELLG